MNEESARTSGSQKRLIVSAGSDFKRSMGILQPSPDSEVAAVNESLKGEDTLALFPN